MLITLWGAVNSLFLAEILRSLLLILINPLRSITPQLSVKGGLVLIVLDDTFDISLSLFSLLDIPHLIAHGK